MPKVEQRDERDERDQATEVADLARRVDELERLLVNVADQTAREFLWTSEMFRYLGRTMVDEADSADEILDGVDAPVAGLAASIAARDLAAVEEAKKTRRREAVRRRRERAASGMPR